MNTKTKKTVMAALMASMVCVATMIIKIPSPMKGYINLGDCVVLLCGFLFSPGYGFMAAGLGSALADILSGYTVYAPATFLIKGAMAPVAYFSFAMLRSGFGKHPSRIMGGILAEAVMIIGYFTFEGFLYGFMASTVNIPANCIQGVAGLILGIVLINVFERLKITLD